MYYEILVCTAEYEFVLQSTSLYYRVLATEYYRPYRKFASDYDLHSSAFVVILAPALELLIVSAARRGLQAQPKPRPTQAPPKTISTTYPAQTQAQPKVEIAKARGR